MFDYVNDRSGAQGTFVLPLLPEPDGGNFTGADMQQAQGVYPGLDIGPAFDVNRLLVYYHHHYDNKDT